MKLLPRMADIARKAILLATTALLGACGGSPKSRTGPTSATGGPLLQRIFIAEHPPFPESHASTLAETPDGVLAAWFGGTREKHPDVCIWTARFDGRKWSEPLQAADGVQPDGRTRHPCWNPVLHQTTKGPLLLFYKVGPSPSTWWGMLKTSTDGGRTWSTAHRLPEGQAGPIRNKPVTLPTLSLEQRGRRLAGTHGANGRPRPHLGADRRPEHA
jgi:BNR repeat-like domain